MPRAGKARAARGDEEITRKEGNTEWQAKAGFLKRKYYYLAQPQKNVSRRIRNDLNLKLKS